MTVHKGSLYAVIHIAIFLIYIGSLRSENITLNPNLVTVDQNILERPIAVNDNFTLAYGCNNHVVTGNLIDNDLFSSSTKVVVGNVTNCNIGIISCDSSGTFIYESDSIYRGDVQINYTLYNAADKQLFSEALLIITIDNDNDCDKIANFIDIDDDNDGILDIHEGDTSIDTDMDGIPDSYDIDSDNDGIIDFIEWQTEGPLILLKFFDSNLDGWDDAFDATLFGNYYEAVDTDLDGFPDFIDSDSDNDGYEDYIEGSDTDADGTSNFLRSGMDKDHDGLDNTFDIVFGWGSRSNPIGSNCPLPDSNSNGIRDWREQSNRIEGEPIALKPIPDVLRIYPNPTYENCTIEVPVDSTDTYEIHVEIFDINGKSLARKTVDDYIFKLNTSFLTSGTYLLRVNTGTKIHRSKFIKRN